MLWTYFLNIFLYMKIIRRTENTAHKRQL